MRIAWLSNAPWAPTGYGNQTNVFVPRLQRLGHELAVIAYYGLEGGVLNWNGIPVYPRAYHPYGQDVAAAHALQFRADILISLMDAWVCQPEALKGVPWCPWFPVDMEPLPPPVKRKVEQAFCRIVFSRFGQRMCEEAGLEVEYVPHSVDTVTFCPQDRRESREKLGWPQDAFIVGMVAANKGTPSRKAFTQQIEAFARLHRRHPDTILYLHTTKAERGELDGVNLPELCEYLGLRVGTDVRFADQYRLVIAYTEQEMAVIYSAMDVLTSVSMGEGFGIPIVEAQACGTPVVVGDWTSMGELCFAGWKVPREEADAWWTPLAAYQWVPRIAAVEACLEEAYNAARDEEIRAKAREGALAYSADRVVEYYWRPVLAMLRDRVLEASTARRVLR